jgi:transcriptional regulator with XRE-family HTH domain
MVNNELALLGRAIARRRIEKGLTYVEVGQRADLHPSHISRIERGFVNPRLSTLQDIADALKLTLGDLLSSVATTPD